ncbi:hypothetical protein SISSUDRAFT_1040673 [Sistotremastrum suecicum HHB10207 ss-3]|uniref:Uncharacterized protein n=1 Tax=Sistotremastrum suecicum HHB10207 ss-3 TaxID=1314776 RepID=A0A166HYY1_9AGAM|nr:hypothetical protein SISSUDRAFT_1040673 [Sistotremastrum suecicum HHB10207 ss-3]
MPLPKLKTTPAEQAETEWRRAKRASKKTRRPRSPTPVASASSSKPRKRTLYDENLGHLDMTEEEYENLRRAAEERRFEEKLLDAMDEDEYGRFGDPRAASLDRWGDPVSIIPQRHKRSESQHDNANLNSMDDETYAEWIREGMYKCGNTLHLHDDFVSVLLTDTDVVNIRRTHKKEAEEMERREKERQARKEREKAERRERRKREKLEEELRQKRKVENERRRKQDRWKLYEESWKDLANIPPPPSSLKFSDIPWPMFDLPADPDALASDAISSFIFDSMSHQDTDDSEGPKPLKDLLRPHLLRFHPDKFEGRIMPLVRESDRELVREGIGAVMRCLNTIAEGNR